ncbi:MAG TPA: PHP domain-containing protein [Dehalococcoidia bacterium]
MLRADLHSHTQFSRDGLTRPEAFVQRCIQKGITCAAVTEHNNIVGALRVQELAPFKVIVGEEVKTTEGEIIGLFLKEPVPKGLTPERTVELIQAQGGIVCVPHPFDRVRRSPLKAEALARILPHVQVLEVFNSRTTLRRDNEKARRFAEEHGLLVSAGTDSHSVWEIGNAWVEMPDFEGPEEFLAALRQGTVHGKRSNPLVHLLSTYAKLRWRLGLSPAR